MTLTFLLALEILDHFELGHQLNFAAARSESGALEREKLISRHLRVVGAKQHAAAFMSRLKELRSKHELAYDVRRSA